MVKKLFLGLFFVSVAALVLLAGFYVWLTAIYASSGGPLESTKQVMIPPGTGSYQIALTLDEEEVIRQPEAFRLLAEIASSPSRFQAGEYEFTRGITPLGVMEKLVSGDVIEYKITIPEGYTSSQIFDLLMAEDSLEGEITEIPAEGRLLPETYHFTRGEQRQKVLLRMAQAQDEALKSLWPTKQADLPVQTPQEVLTLASIVEKETGIPSERRRIAAVYINRLRINMPLQADPTVAYGIYGGQFADKPLTYDDLKKDHPYNTYTRPGLPQGPICHPGKDSIAAVLDPLKTKELYFVATGDGGHRFAETHAQHLQNVAAYRKWQRSQK